MNNKFELVNAKEQEEAAFFASVFGSVEICYYPMIDDFITAADEFFTSTKLTKVLTIEIGMMSTLVTGEFQSPISLFNQSMGALMEKYSSVYNLKITNAYFCLVMCKYFTSQ